MLHYYFSEEDRAAKQSEVNLLMDEVERAQTRLLSLEREKVSYRSGILFNTLTAPGESLALHMLLLENYLDNSQPQCLYGAMG